VDTLGYNYLVALVHVDTAATTSDIPTELKLSEADVTTVSSTSAIVALTGGTATSTSVGFVIPAADTSNSDVFALKLDLRGRKRYIFASYSPGVAAATLSSACAVLFRGEQTPDTAAEDGSPVRTVG
jgi:hypothetical protein